MAFTVIVESTDVSENRLNVRCVLTDGASQKIPHVFTFGLGATFESAKTDIRDFIAGIDFSSTLAAQIPKGVFDVTAAPDPPPPDPTPAQIWRQSLNRLISIKQLVDLAVVAPDDAFFTDQLALVKSTFDPSFIAK